MRTVEGDGVEVFDVHRRELIKRVQVSSSPVGLVFQVMPVTAHGTIKKLPMFYHKETNPFGLFGVSLAKKDLCTSNKFILHRDELESPLALAYVMARLGGLTSLGCFAEKPFSSLGEAGVDCYEIQSGLSHLSSGIVATGSSVKPQPHALLGGAAYRVWVQKLDGSFSCIDRGDKTYRCGELVLRPEETRGFPTPPHAELLDALSNRPIEKALFCGRPLLNIVREQKDFDESLKAEERRDLFKNQKDSSRAAAAASALERALLGGDAAPFLVEDPQGGFRHVRIAFVNVGRKPKAYDDDDIRCLDLIDNMCAAGAVVVRDGGKDESDVALCFKDTDWKGKRKTIAHVEGFTLKQKAHCVLVFEEVIPAALELSVSLLSSDPEVVSLRKSCSVFRRRPLPEHSKARYEMVDGIKCYPLDLGNGWEWDVRADLVAALAERKEAESKTLRRPTHKRLVGDAADGAALPPRYDSTIIASAKRTLADAGASLEDKRAAAAILMDADVELPSTLLLDLGYEIVEGHDGPRYIHPVTRVAHWNRPTARAAPLVLHGGDDGADTALAPLVLRGDGSLDSSKSDGSLDGSNDDESLDNFIDDDESLDRDESEVEEAAVGSSESESDDEALEGDAQDWDAPDPEAIPRARSTRAAAAAATQNLAEPSGSDSSDMDMDDEDDLSESDN